MPTFHAFKTAHLYKQIPYFFLLMTLFVQFIYFLHNRWFKGCPLPETRAFACAATLKREIWLWGGVTNSMNEDGYLMSTNTVLVYKPEVMKWEPHITVGTMKHAAAIAKVGKLFLKYCYNELL